MFIVPLLNFTKKLIKKFLLSHLKFTFFLLEWQVSRILFKDGHSSGPAVARWLKQPTRALRGRKPISPARPCSRRGLPCSACYQADGEPLPHHFTLTRQKTWRAV